MKDVESLVKTTLEEIERILSTKTVVGEPIAIEGATLIPLISIGFGFGAGSASGKGESEKGEGAGGGTGGGAGVKPVAVIIVDKQGVRVESIKGGFAAAIEKLGETIPRMMQKRKEEKKEG